MTAREILLPELLRPEELRVMEGARGTPTTTYLAEVLRASASAMFDGSYSAAQGEDASSISGRRIRVSAAERLRPLFSIGQAGEAAFFSDSESEADLSAPELRFAFDALVETGDFVDVGNGRIYPSRMRVLELGEGLWGIIAGSALEELGLAGDDLQRRSLMRLSRRRPPDHFIEQSLSNWMGLSDLDYARYAREQLARAVPSIREDASKWLVANVTGAATQWVEASKWTVFNRPLVVRRRRDEDAPWERFVARLKPAVRGVECVGARLITFVECSRILHGQKLAMGFGRTLRGFRTDSGIVVSCDTYQLPEIRRVLLALSFDCVENDDRVSFALSSEFLPHAEKLLARVGFKLHQSQ